MDLTPVRSKECFSSRPEEYRGFTPELQERDDDSDHMVYKQNRERTRRPKLQDNQNRMKTRQGTSEYYQQQVENKLKREQKKQEEMQRYRDFQKNDRLLQTREQVPQDRRIQEQAEQQAKQVLQYEILQEQGRELIRLQRGQAMRGEDFPQVEMSGADDGPREDAPSDASEEGAHRPVPTGEPRGRSGTLHTMEATRPKNPV